MKKCRGFTLIELLIVTVVIVTLMGLVFRLAGTGGESSARAKTLARLQKLSNALSGYYAAFGSYPPVPLQGRSRDINTPTDGGKDGGSLGYGIQAGPDEALNTCQLKNDDSEDAKTMRRQIEAACRAQPLGAGYPYNPMGNEKKVFDAMANELGMGPYDFITSYSSFNARNSSEWSENNVFMFGLMSFLLPRYQFMLDGAEELYDDQATPNSPWATNNRRPFLMNGSRLKNWEEAQGALQMGPNHWNDSSSANAATRTMLENLPSQAVCARWMPNFAGIVATIPVEHISTFFGVDTRAPRDYGNDGSKWFVISSSGYGGSGGSSKKNIIQCYKTVLDGWGEEFYYYSPPPYQSYQLWSSGPNKRTFPPWMETTTLQTTERKYVNEWIADDIKVGDK